MCNCSSDKSCEGEAQSVSWAVQGPKKGGFLEEVSLRGKNTIHLRNRRKARWPKTPKNRGMWWVLERQPWPVGQLSICVFSVNWWVKPSCDLVLKHQIGWSVETRLERGSVHVWRAVGRLLWSYLPEKRVWGLMSPTCIWPGEKPTVGFLWEDRGKAKLCKLITTSLSSVSFCLPYLPEGH